MCKNNLQFVLFISVFLWGCEYDKKINFEDGNFEINNLNGKWELIQMGVLSNLELNLFNVDSTNFNYKKLNIDTEKMIYHLTSYPFKNSREYPSKIFISNDTIKITSGTTINNEIKILIKKYIIFKISNNLNYLKLFDTKDNTVMIFSKNL
ncbi:MAG: hypothetical protein CBD31_05345 [Flavobacteriaceae bacterium TMED171]|nr:hypothetical protein [Flavobacteriaceae bacterium]OUW31167.1 MAG: hypothetical protein CBD31_05345 [Flavobacteriaceae bacterium TMED171]|tara:strand:- start:545 stop:997 length:453 start_codon:yes stop_codon:yes gene_type:complete